MSFYCVFYLLIQRRARSTLFPYTTLFRSRRAGTSTEPASRPIEPGRARSSRSWLASWVPYLRPSRRRRRSGWSRRWRREPDRKSTRLNSSHVEISYAVFCLKKKKKKGKIKTKFAEKCKKVNECFNDIFKKQFDGGKVCGDREQEEVILKCGIVSTYSGQDNC